MSIYPQPFQLQSLGITPAAGIYKEKLLNVSHAILTNIPKSGSWRIFFDVVSPNFHTTS